MVRYYMVRYCRVRWYKVRRYRVLWEDMSTVRSYMVLDATRWYYTVIY